jgi:outer membrane receptor protein involved in Fe transport
MERMVGWPRQLIVPLLLGATLFAARDVPADEPPSPENLEPFVVTGTRIEQPVGESVSSVTVLTAEDIRRSAGQTVDDILRQVPGFSLFRRASSLVAHPTSQGVSLRGIGPSGTSRALVLLDGVPINDPFGGWVPWSKIPLQAIEQIEVVRGGGSSVWGNYALGGVINIITKRPTERRALLEGSYGNRSTTNLDLLVTETLDPVRVSLEGNVFNTEGYRIVDPPSRGRIDIPADSQHAVFNGRVEFVKSPDLSLFVSGNFFDENRGNGTPLQFNSTETGSFATGVRLRTNEGSEWTIQAFGQVQDFRSTFSTQAADRNSETLALDQTVPATSYGGSLQWNRRFASHLVSSGADVRWIRGETDEGVFGPGGFLRNRVAGGEQAIGGLFLQDVFTPDSRWELVGGVRGDYWIAYEGFRRDTPPPVGVPAAQSFSDRDWLIASPRLAALFHATPSMDLRASVYRGFRVPTINELYRVFRVRNDVTVANAQLRPERLTGGEIGVQQRWAIFNLRLTAFWNEITDLVTNVTLSTPLPDCPAGTTCRQRQNLDLARVRGIEAEGEFRPAASWRVLATYVFIDARVAAASQQRSLEGLRLPQVPAHVGTLVLRYENPTWGNAAVVARYVGMQFEDDANMLPLGGYFVADLLLSRAVATFGEVFLGIENLFSRTYAVGRSTDGITTIGAPFLIHGGVRLNF